MKFVNLTFMYVCDQCVSSTKTSKTNRVECIRLLKLTAFTNNEYILPKCTEWTTLRQIEFIHTLCASVCMGCH